MLEFIPFAIALIGSSIAAAWDLKTTEIPDEISYIMIAAALLIYGMQSLLAWDYWPLLSSCIVGLSFLGFGFVMYYFGQWGGGDAKVLAAIGFLLPTAPAFLKFTFFFPFPISYIINVFLVGAAYMLAYAVAIAAMNEKVMHEFKRDVKASSMLLLVAFSKISTTTNAFVLLNGLHSTIFTLSPTAASMQSGL